MQTEILRVWETQAKVALVLACARGSLRDVLGSSRFYDAKGPRAKRDHKRDVDMFLKAVWKDTNLRRVARAQRARAQALPPSRVFATLHDAVVFAESLAERRAREDRTIGDSQTTRDEPRLFYILSLNR